VLNPFLTTKVHEACLAAGREIMKEHEGISPLQPSMAGEVTGEARLAAVRAIRGNKALLVTDFTSSMAELSGGLPSVFTETCAESGRVMARRRAEIR